MFDKRLMENESELKNHLSRRLEQPGDRNQFFKSAVPPPVRPALRPTPKEGDIRSQWLSEGGQTGRPIHQSGWDLERPGGRIGGMPDPHYRNRMFGGGGRQLYGGAGRRPPLNGSLRDAMSKVAGNHIQNGEV
jgi:hypothetical protein